MSERSYNVQNALLEIIEEYEGKYQFPDETPSWERIHMVSSARIGYVLAAKRGVDPDLAACACSVHDFGRIITGKQAGHAEAGYLPVKEFLLGLACFSSEEIEEISNAVRNHSNKGEIGTALEEIVKDADILDMQMYGRALSRDEQRERLEKLIERNEI